MINVCDVGDVDDCKRLYEVEVFSVFVDLCDAFKMIVAVCNDE
jgi:hypothetical protein